jgi:predicted phosphodiesterase
MTPTQAVRKYLEDHPEAREWEAYQIADALAHLGLDRSSVRRAALREKPTTTYGEPIWREQRPEDEPAEHHDAGDPDGARYARDDDAYTFWPEGEHTLTLSHDIISDICWYYTNQGGKRSGRWVCDFLYKRHGLTLTEDLCRHVLRALNKRKTSSPFPPHMHDRYTPEELAKILETRHEREAVLYLQESEAKTWRNLFEREKRKTLRVEELAADLGSPEVCWHIHIKNERPVDASLEPCDLVLLWGDWHVGKAFRKPWGSFDHDVLHARLDAMLAEIEEHFAATRRPIEAVHIWSLGDGLDGVTGRMHPKQGWHQDLRGAEQIQALATTHARCVRHVYELARAPVSVHWIQGNHDRMSDHRDDDPTREAGRVAAWWCEDKLSGLQGLEWMTHDDYIGSAKVRQTLVMGLHGDFKPKSLRDLAWDHRRADVRDYVICYGHLHSLRVEGVTDDRGVMTVRNGSPVGTDPYARKLGLGARPSQAMFEVRDSGARPVMYLPM